MKTLVAALLIFTAVIINIWLHWPTPPAPLSTVEKLELLWVEDLKRLRAAKTLPAQWAHIRSLEVTALTPEARGWLKSVTVPVKINPQGAYRLEILLLSMNEEGKTAAVIQYDLVNLKTKNLIWELSRTIVLEQSENVTKEP